MTLAWRSAAVFIAVAVLVALGATRGIDLATTHAFQSVASYPLDVLANWHTLLGQLAVTLPGAAVLAVVVWRRHGGWAWLAPLAILARVLPIVPRDGVIRTLEVMLPWYAPGQLEAGRRLWEAVRHEWHDRATHVATVVDPKGQAAEMCRVSPLTPGPRLKLMVPVDSPVPLSESKPVTMIR